MLLDINREEDLKTAVDALRAGRLVAFPTETVYGLGADGFNEDACRAVYAAKGRPSDNPLILHIADMAALRDIAAEVPEAAVDLAEAFWPGPLTLVLKKRRNISDVVSGGLDTVAVRMPDNDLARKLIRAVGHPLAGPSANLSGRPSPTLAAHVEHDFGDHIAGVVDGGPCRVGVESTIVDLTVTPYTILRPGGIPREKIEALIGPVREAAPIADESDTAPKAPGMKYRHYAPQAPAYLLTGDRRAEKILARLETATRPVGMLIADETLAGLGVIPEDVFVWNMGSFAHPDEAAHRLFDGLRRMDAYGVTEIYIDAWPLADLGEALMNRIGKLSQPWPDTWTTDDTNKGE